ncbi:MAG: hypothetical protein ACR2IV_20215 [Bryobacteraceae bacterium]
MNTFYANDAPSAVIQLASPDADGRKRTVPCSFQGSEGKRLVLHANEPVPISSAVSVEFNDALFLGEVVACTGGVNRSCNIEIKIEQILSGLQSLMALRSHLLSEGVPQQRPALIPVAK